MGRSAETLLRLTTLNRVKAELGRTTFAAIDNQRLDAIIQMISREAAGLMGGAVYKTQRVERFDVKAGHKLFFTDAWPIDTTTAPVVVNNTDEPRVWTDTDDVIDADYVICNADMAERGLVRVDDSLLSGPDALQITYTGGIASFVGAEGVDGVCAAGSLSKFTSVTGRFITDGVAVGSILVIETGANIGSWRISAVGLDTEVTCDRVAGAAEATVGFAFTAATGQSYHILDSNSESLITDWPEIAEAATAVVEDYWRMRGGRKRVVSESAGGVSQSYGFTASEAPYSMPYFARNIFAGMKKKRVF